MGGIPIEYDGRGFLLLFKTDSVAQRVVLEERRQTAKRMMSKWSDIEKGRNERGSKVNGRKSTNGNINNHSSRKDMKSDSKHGSSTNNKQSSNLYRGY